MTVATTEALIEQDARGIITDWDAEAERLFGWRRADAIGMPSSALIPARNHDQHAAALRDVVADRERRGLPPARPNVGPGRRGITDPVPPARRAAAGAGGAGVLRDA